MAFYENKNPLTLAEWIQFFLLLDIVVYFLLLIIFPNLWFIGIIFGILIIGMIVSSLIYKKMRNDRDDHWKKPAEVLLSVNVSLNAIFCIVISATIIMGVFIAASSS